MIRHYRTGRLKPNTQCRCAWCSKWVTDLTDCLSVEQKDALARYARKQGGYWKSRLAVEWETKIASELLTQAMNIIGLDGLYKLSSKLVKDYYPPKQKQENGT